MAKKDGKRNNVLLESFEYAAKQKRRGTENIIDNAYQYYEGIGHWTSAEGVVLESEGRLVTTLNYIFKIINTISGNERQARNDLHVFPTESGDVTMSNILNYGFKHVKKQNNLDWKTSDVAFDGFLTGQGWFKNYIELVKEKRDGKDVLVPEIRIKKISPKLIYFDPDSIEYDLSDCKNVFEANWIHKEKLEKMYPKTKDEIEKWFSDKNISERKLYVNDDRHLARLVDAEYVVYESEEWYYDGRTLSKKPFKDAKKYNHVNKKYMWRRFFGDVVLEELEDPYGCGGYSYTAAFPYFANGRGVSIFEQIRDAQDIINKSHSQFMDALNRQIGVGVMYEEGSIEDEEIFEKFKRGDVVKVPAGSISGGKIKILDPQEYPVAHAKTVDDAIKLMKEIVGITEVFEGFAPGRIESGLGVQILRKQSGLVFEQPEDNIRYSQILLGRKTLNQIQKFWSDEKVMRIVGDDGNFKDINITDKEIRISDIDKNTGKNVGETQIFANKLKEGKYDFVIDVNQPSATTKQYNLMLGMDIFKMVPDPRLIPLLINLTDFPYKDEWIQTLTQVVNDPQQSAAGGGGGILEAITGGAGG